MQRHARFVQGAESQVTAALDVDGRQVHGRAGHIQEVAQVFHQVAVQGIRHIARQVAQSAKKAGIVAR